MASPEASPMAMGDTTVMTAETPELGTFLVDAEGMTLYLFTNDTEGVSNCEGDCLANWPAFTAEDPLTLPEGVPGELTQIERSDGSMQVAYNGMPLYYWIGDKAPGDTTGQGVGDVWFVVEPAE
jgi:predicted lipoprotein with Yx(FWY)xxD motif